MIAFLQTLRLTLHKERAVVYPTRTGIPWLGFRVYPEYRRLRKDNVKAFRRRLRKLQADYAAGQVVQERVKASIQSWIAHASHANTYRLRQQILSGVAFSRGEG